MGIEQKIDEIRRKPERIRLRWVWTLTVIFTMFIVIFWILSIKNQPKKLMPLNNQQGFIDEFQQQKKSIKDTTEGMKNVLQNSPIANEKDLNSQNPVPDNKNLNSN